MNAVTTFASGTLSSSAGGTEDFLSSPAVVGRFQLKVDLNAMQAGDVVELRAYGMAIAGGTSRRVVVVSYQGAQPANALIAYLPEMINDLTDTNALRFSLTQTVGSSRNFPWAVMRDTPFGAAAMTELAQAAPTATPTPEEALMLLYMALRNQVVVDKTALEKQITNNAGTVIAKKPITTTATVYTEGEMVSGP